MDMLTCSLLAGQHHMTEYSERVANIWYSFPANRFSTSFFFRYIKQSTHVEPSAFSNGLQCTWIILATKRLSWFVF